MLIDSPFVTGSLVVDGELHLPSGTTAQRPSGPLTGSLRFNTDSGSLELYNGTQWSAVQGGAASPAAASADIEYLVVAGGGGGGGRHAGGGGAGGYLSSSLASVQSGSSFTITVGSGGSGGIDGTTTGKKQGTSGTNSTIAGTTITTITAIAGGGGGGDADDSNPPDGLEGLDGGSGGGASYEQSGGSGTAGQGFAGGDGQSAPNYSGGGGGGASTAGTNASGTTAGSGGAGLAFNITGTSITRAGGGGGGGWASTNAGTGGSGGGGNGVGNAGSANAGAGTVNFGAGGGGGGGDNSAGGSGGSGVAILAYPTGSVNGAGGIVGTTSSGKKYHQFNSSGTLSIGAANDFQVDTTNLQGWWDAGDYSSRGDSTWVDKMGNYNLTKGGSPTLGNNFYYTFTANGEYYNTSLTPINGAKAMVLWIKYTGSGGNGYSLTGWQEGTSYCYLGRQDSNGRYYYYIGNSTGGEAATSPTLNTWYMLTLTNNSSGNFEFYENDGSTTIASGTGINMGTNGTSRFNIGSVSNTGGHRNHAQIGMCFYYTKYLTSSDVNTLYNATKHNFV